MPKSLTKLGNFDCRYIVGRDESRLFPSLYCAEPVLQGESWCEVHFCVVFRQSEQNRRRGPRMPIRLPVDTIISPVKRSEELSVFDTTALGVSLEDGQ